MLTAVTGIAAGIFHVLAGPDHLAAVMPLALADRQRGWLAGWTWGVGHASGVVVVAILAVIVRYQLPSIEVLSGWSERLVGGALIAIGFWALRRSAQVHTSEHAHGVVSHDHLAVHAGPARIRQLGHAHAAFYMGVLHGVAGSSHFFGVLPALALPNARMAVLYIVAFGVGTVVAMTGFAAVVGSVAVRQATMHRLMMRTAAVLAFAVGGWWLLA